MNDLTILVDLSKEPNKSIFFNFKGGPRTHQKTEFFFDSCTRLHHEREFNIVRILRKMYNTNSVSLDFWLPSLALIKLVLSNDLSTQPVELDPIAFKSVIASLKNYQL